MVSTAFAIALFSATRIAASLSGSIYVPSFIAISRSVLNCFSNSSKLAMLISNNTLLSYEYRPISWLLLFLMQTKFYMDN